MECVKIQIHNAYSHITVDKIESNKPPNQQSLFIVINDKWPFHIFVSTSMTLNDCVFDFLYFEEKILMFLIQLKLFFFQLISDQ